MFGNDTFTLEEDQYMIIGDYESMTALRDEALALNTPVTIYGKTLTPKYKKVKKGLLKCPVIILLME